ncbi:WXG100 family type VII secretion target [Quadrisphaera sp. GCM10027208]|uniref:WXG100 family type VII secretion target n=1 Tax=Quadrisphaera sp. GCM10027208 TaxID=3273423 RepID=UPI0036D232B8
MAGEMKVNFGGLDAAAADIQASARQIESRLAQLDSELAPLRSDWTGAASDAYHVARSEWSRAITDMQQLLAQVGTAVSTSNAEYQAAERANQSRW